MKHILTILFIFFNTFVYSTVCETISDGNWTDPIWSCGVPSNEDTIIVNHNITITDPNLTISTSIVLIVNDTLFFDGGKLNLETGSIIVINTNGLITSDDKGNNDKIKIGSEIIWTANDGDLGGYVIITEPGVVLLFEPKTDSVYSKKEETEELIIIKRYSLNGSEVDKYYKGIQIIHYNNNTWRKIYHY